MGQLVNEALLLSLEVFQEEFDCPSFGSGYFRCLQLSTVVQHFFGLNNSDSIVSVAYKKMNPVLTPSLI